MVLVWVALGDVRAFEPPHTGTNYLLKEFVYIVGRNHSAKLRIITLILMIGTPVFAAFVTVFPSTRCTSSYKSYSGIVHFSLVIFCEAEHVVRFIMETIRPI